MPIKEALAIASLVLTGIFITHPADFVYQVEKLEFTILKEASRVDNWSRPELFETENSINRLHEIQTHRTRLRQAQDAK